MIFGMEKPGHLGHYGDEKFDVVFTQSATVSVLDVQFMQA